MSENIDDATQLSDTTRLSDSTQLSDSTHLSDATHLASAPHTGTTPSTESATQSVALPNLPAAAVTSAVRKAVSYYWCRLHSYGR